MKVFLRLACLLLALFLCSCSLPTAFEGEESEETTYQKETEPAETEPEPEPEPEIQTFTLPHYQDMAGDIQWEYEYSPDGLSLSKTVNTEEPPIIYTVYFDENKKPKKTEWTVQVNDTRTEKWEDVYTLDEKGNIIFEKRYCEGELQHTYTYTYDEKGNMISQLTHKQSDSTEYYYELFYDEMGECISITHSLNGAAPTNYKEGITNTYDDKGRIETTVASTHSISYEYSEKEGLVTTKKATYNGGDSQWSYYYQYTYENSKLIKEESYFFGALSDTIYYTESEHEHYVKALDWVFRERLP